jgi:hypothetical protein
VSNLLLALWPAYALIAGTLLAGYLAGVAVSGLLTLRDLARGSTVEECSDSWPEWLSSPRS